MAAFPAIEPIGRRYGLGAHPMATAGFSSLDEVRFLQGATLSGVSMALEFRAISISEATQIRDHYLGQREHRSFDLPAALWRTHSSQFNVVPAASVWRYAGQPQESPRPGGLVDVTVSLISAFDPTVARLVSGGTFAQSPTLSAGSLAGYTLVSGGMFTQTPTLAPGTAGALGAPAPMLAFTSGTSMAWAQREEGEYTEFAYGFSFTLASPKQITGVGFYDAGGDGLLASIAVAVFPGTPSYPDGNEVVIRPTFGGFANRIVAIQSGTATPLDGVWRKVGVIDGATLQPGTYAIFAYTDYGSGPVPSIPLIKNAIGMTAQDGVTINGPLAFEYFEGVYLDSAGDGPGYFGPILFF